MDKSIITREQWVFDRLNYWTYKEWLSTIAYHGYRRHHKAKAHGHIKQNQIIVEKYNGRFGEGFVIKEWCNQSANMMYKTYYIKNTTQDNKQLSLETEATPEHIRDVDINNY